MKNRCRKTRQSKQTKRLAQYSATAGAFLMVTTGAKAGITYSGPLREYFGSTYGTLDVTMEGSNPEMRLWGNEEMGNTNSFGVQRIGDNFSVSTVGTMAHENSAAKALSLNRLINSPDKTQAVFWKESSFEKTYTNHVKTDMGLFTHTTTQTRWVKTSTGVWDKNGETAYIGFSFELEDSGKDVFGWAEIMRLDSSNGALLGWAYQDSGASILAGELPTVDPTPDPTPAPVPEPSSLTLLALGFAGVGCWRKRKQNRS